MAGTLAITFITLLFGGCGRDDVPSGNASSAFDQSYRASFRVKFVDECQAETRKASGTDKDFSAPCGCVADKLIANKTVGELMTSPSSEDSKRYADECFREHPIT